jgi:hypothetical protein
MRCIDFENGLGTGVLPGDKSAPTAVVPLQSGGT